MKKFVLLVAFCAAALMVFEESQNATPEETRLDDLRVERDIQRAALPLEQAIKLVRGNGELTLAVFEDPNCPYCKKLDKKLAQLDNVTLYIFLYPILSEDSLSKSRRIWCADAPVQVWRDWMVNQKIPAGTESCDVTAIRNNLKFGQQTLGIRGVPYLLRVN
jgi:thiol:disulfide interchange protein DsbC